MRWPETNSARSHQCEPMSANAREAPPSSASTRQLSSSGREQPVLQVACRGAGAARRSRRWRRARAPRGRSGRSGRRTARAATGARAGRQVGEAPGAGDVERERLLADDVLAGRRARASASGTCRWFGRADVDDVDVGVARPAPRRESKRALRAELGGRGASALGRRGGDARELGRRPARTSVGVDAPDEPGAGDRGSSSGHRRGTVNGAYVRLSSKSLPSITSRKPSIFVRSRALLRADDADAVPTVSAPASGAARVLRLIRERRRRHAGGPRAARPGLARSTVAQRVDALLANGLVYEAGGSDSTGGRPPTVLAFNRGAGVVLAADLGATHSRARGERPGAASRWPSAPATLDIARGPGARCSSWVEERFARAAARGRPHARGRARHRRRRAGAGRVRQRPAGQPADHAGLGRLPDPGVVRRPLPARRSLVDNDVNIMALRRALGALARDASTCCFVKVGTGIGCGIVADGHIHRGADGAAGDIGHIRVDRRTRTSSAAAATSAASRRSPAAGRSPTRLAAQGVDADAQPRRRPPRAASGHAEAIRMVREPGRTLGEVLAGMRQLLQPARDRDRRRHRARPTSSSWPACARWSSSARCRSPRGTCASCPSQLGDRAGVIGAAIMVIEHVLSPAAVDRSLAPAA